MSIFDQYRQLIAQSLASAARQQAWTPPDPLPPIKLEAPRDPAHGDFATNAAMTLAKPLGKPPRAVAEAILPFLKAAATVADAEIAGPGFINLRLKPAAWHAELKRILQEDDAYGLCRIGKGVRVNTICPGNFETDMQESLAQFEQALIKRTPLRRFGPPEDLDGALLLLASDAGRYMTGAVITVDGGQTLSWM